MPRVFASPGTIYEPEGEARDYWRTARALHAAGFRAGELVHNCFSYHMTPAGSIMESGARALGCTVFAGGTGQTEQQVEAIADLRPAGYAGTPSFLKIILEKAAEKHIALPSLTKALVSGEAFPPSLRDWIAERGVAGVQCYATADLGLVAYETRAREGLVLDEGVLVEIVRPGTGDPVPEGEVGEIVVTTLTPTTRWSASAPATSRPCCRAPARPGAPTPASRAGSAAPTRPPRCAACSCIRGQVAEIARRFPEVARRGWWSRARWADDRMTLKLECAMRAEGLAARVGETIRDVTKLRGAVELCAGRTAQRWQGDRGPAQVRLRTPLALRLLGRAAAVLDAPMSSGRGLQGLRLGMRGEVVHRGLHTAAVWRHRRERGRSRSRRWSLPGSGR